MSTGAKIRHNGSRIAERKKFLTGLPDANGSSSVDQWLLWQIADSAFPTGGFAHSSGLEAAWQHGEVRNSGDLLSFVEASLRQLGRAALPFALAAYDEPKRFDEFDALCEAFTTNHVANRASRAQGRAFHAAAQRIFTHGRNRGVHPSKDSSADDRDFGATSWASPQFGHFACVFGAVMKRLGVERATAMRLFFFNHLRGLLAAAVRLNIIGPMEAQTLQHRSSSFAEDVLTKCESLTLDDITQTSPLLDIWHGAQDRLYSRLFQS